MEPMEQPKKKKTNGKRNRYAGHEFERSVVALLKEHGFLDVITTRSGSRHRDNQGIDIMNSEELKQGRLPFNIQCKNINGSVNYAKLLDSLPKDEGIVNVIFHKFTEVRGKAGLFHPRGHYAILNMHDFVRLIAELHNLKKVNNDSVD